MIISIEGSQYDIDSIVEAVTYINGYNAESEITKEEFFSKCIKDYVKGAVLEYKRRQAIELAMSNAESESSSLLNKINITTDGTI